MNLHQVQKRIISSFYKYILDIYPITGAAFSLRKLRKDYNGFCIEVRRSSDNALQNIGFVKNKIDVTSLLSFVGSGNGFVRTWYDQGTTSNNGIQTNNSFQPKIVSSGTIETFLGKPSLNFENAYLDFSTIQNTPNYLAIVGLIDRKPLASGAFIPYAHRSDSIPLIQINSLNSTDIALQMRSSSTSLTTVTVTLTINDPVLFFGQYNNVTPNHQLLVNDIAPSSSNVLFSGTIFADYNNIGTFQKNIVAISNNGKISELIITPTNYVINKDGVFNNINSYYNVF